MMKLGTLTAAALAISGLVLFAIGIYFMRFPNMCDADESHIVCLRSWLAAVGPIIASVALLVAFWQFYLSRDTSQRQLRAYVGVADGSIQLVNLTDVGGQGISAYVRIRNNGRTPAYEFTTWFAQPVVAEANTPPFGPPLPFEERTSSSILFSDSDAHISRATPITAEDLAAIRDGSKKVFVWGGVDYADAFGRKRTMRFHDVNGVELGAGSGRWQLMPHRKGYQAD